ncbi:hypothetical protein [Streptomyces sp. AC555_RSS877]|uniref:hypothetical protein n=1 Tax=Streptomyces sp. AC555_RSS877 TaxID=2823688 RepID=UPI001C2657E4|nr:hypothetical protein [Streptomyces sp. AC555_RSS877]
MIERELTGAATDGSGDAQEGWDFRLDRTGLMVAAGRYLQLRVSLGLLFIIIGLVAGWGTVQMDWLPL